MEELKNLYSLKDIINIRFDIFKDKVAFIEKDSMYNNFEYIKYGVLKDKINGLGTYMLKKLNLKGKKVAVIGENSYRWYMTYMAVACGVGVIVPLDKGLPDNEILNLIKRADVQAIVYSSRKAETINSLKKELSDEMIYIEMNKNESDKESLSFDRIIENGIKLVNEGNEEYINAKIDREEMSILLFTSGTSAKSKGVMLSHKNLCSNIYSCSCVVPTFGNYTCLSILPIHHTYEFTLDYLFMTAAGGTIGICQGLKYLIKDFKTIRPDFILAVPAIIEKFNQIIENGIKETGKEKVIDTAKNIASVFSKFGIDFRRKLFAKIHENFGGNLKYLFCGAAPLDPELITKMESYGFKFLQGYGLTETSPLVTGTSLKCDASGTVGKAVEGVEVRIDLSKNEDENSNIGEIIVKGNNVMIGYYQDAEETEKVLKDDWFYTGDLGYFDLRGNLIITGRTKNVIVMNNGKNVFPEELETLINKIPYIAESMVYDKKEKNLKESMLTARVSLDMDYINEKFENNIPSDYELYTIIFDEIKKVNRMMPSYKIIKEVEIKKDEFAKTTTMKIKRYEEIENTDYNNIITKDILKQNKENKKKKIKIVNVKAEKLNKKV